MGARPLTFVTTYDPNQSDLGGASWVDRALLDTLNKSFLVDVHQICGEASSGRVPLEIRNSKRLMAGTLTRMLALQEAYQVAKFRVSPQWNQEVQKIRALAETRSRDHLIVTSQWPALLLLADAGIDSDLHIAHNVDTVISRSHDPVPFGWIGNSRRMEAKERQILRRPKAVLAISKSDADRIRQWGVDCTHLSIAPQSFAERQAASTVIGFIGKASWPPNARAIHLLVEEVLPKVREAVPSVRVVLTGRGTEKWAGSEGVTSLGRIDHLSDFYDLADLVVVPRLGESTGVSVKMLEAVTFGRPVVVPTMLARDAGLEQGVITADDLEDTVRAITDYFSGRASVGRLAADHAEKPLVRSLKLNEVQDFLVHDNDRY